jgi:gamma-glutamyl phosphate reductase
MLRMDKYIDMLIPRGGAGLHKLCREQSTIPVITGGIGVCHIVVDDSAEIEPALKIIVNAKTQRPSTCNTGNAAGASGYCEHLPAGAEQTDGGERRDAAR